MKILVTGASGLVGSAFVRLAAQQGHEVVGVVGSFTGRIEGLAECLRIDLTDENAVWALRRVHAEAIVNCAAMSSPAACEADPERAAVLNVNVPIILAELANRVAARFVHLSSEQVYDGGRTTPYAADETPSPVNVYGRQKRQGEIAVLSAAGPLVAVLRPPLMLGNSVSGTRSLHEAMLASWSAGKPVSLFVDEFRQPCTARNLASVMLAIAGRRDIAGVFNWAGTDLVSRCELGERIRRHFGLAESAAPIVRVTRGDTPTARTRPACLALDTAPLRALVDVPPQSLDEQLAELHLPPAPRV